MADNLQVLVEAILSLKDTTASKEEIKKGLPSLSNQLANDKNARVNIVAGLDITKTKQLINAQLATIGKDIKIDVGNIDVGSLKNTAQQIQNSVSAINNSVTSVSGNGILSNNFTKTFDNTKNALALAKQEFAQFNNVASVTGNWIKGVNGNLTGFTVNVKNTAGAIESFKYRLEEIDKVKSFFFQGSTGADSGILKMSQDIENAKVKYERLIADFKSSNSAIISGLSQPLADVETKLNTLGKGTGINELTNSFEKLKTSASEITKYLDTTNNSFNKSTNAVNNYKEMDTTLTKLTTNYNNLIVKNSELGNQITDAKTKLSELQAIEKQNGTNAEWAKQYQLVNTEIKSIATNLQIAQKAESADKNSTAQQQLKYYGKIREEITLIQNLKKKLPSAGEEEIKVLNHQIELAEKRKKTAEKQIEKKKLYNEELFAENNILGRIYEKELEIVAAKQKDKTNATTSKQNQADIQLSAEIQNASTRLKALEQQWKNQGILVGEFKTEVDKLGTSLSNVTDIKGFKEYGNSLKNVQNTASLLNKELSASKGTTKLAQDIQLATARVTAFEKANSKALPIFGARIDEVRTKMSKATNDAELIKYKREFQLLTKEVYNAGKAGDNLAVKFKNAFAKFSGWMSVTTIIMSLARNITTAANELKEVDTILTEISKTSDRTADSLRKLGEEAFTAASKYGVTASGYLTGVQEMSRAGFGDVQSEQLAELSILAQSAGDMTAELSNQYLIATNAAYGLKGNVEQLNNVLDSQNYITNRNALNMENLADATKLAASQAASTGVGVDELTAAVGTMIATTQQGGDVAGRAFKGILMNLQLVKAEADEIGDGGEAITDESLSKYEKACVDLGVALKEVKDGVWTLRDPMTVLNELAVAFNKEAENSVKKANLISAVGGKYRGNQLSALLSNWTTYQKMLSEFNSQESVGSAFEEAMKTADSWEGRLNKLSNTWTSVVQNFLKTDDIKNVLSFATNILDILDKIIEKIGIIPTVIGGIGIGKALSGAGRTKMIVLINMPA